METNLEDLADSINVVWVSISTYLIFFMQAGFLVLEAGFVKMKDYSHLTLLVLINICVCTLAWFFTGYAFAFGNTENAWIGTSYFFGDGLGTNNLYAHFLFQWVFALDTVICTGCICERINFKGYTIMCILNGLWVYPVIVHWGWGGGWLSRYGYEDFAGSGIVHLTGGTIGLVTAIILGPRLGRFDEANKEEFLPSNPTLIGLGTLILWFGWYGFNCGSTASAIGASATTISLVGLNTSLSAAAGGMVALGINHFYHKGEEGAGVPAICNGILAGTVAITAPCNNVEPWAAIIIGIVAAIIYTYMSGLMIKLKIDDPVDAFPLHGGCGAFGVISVGFFDMTNGLFYTGDFNLLLVQLLGVGSILIFSGACTFITMFILNRFGWVRMSKEDEEKGSDSYLTHRLRIHEETGALTSAQQSL